MKYYFGTLPFTIDHLDCQIHGDSHLHLVGPFVSYQMTEALVHEAVHASDSSQSSDCPEVLPIRPVNASAATIQVT